MQQEVVVKEVQSSEKQGKTHVEDEEKTEEDAELECEGTAECECNYDQFLTTIAPGHRVHDVCQTLSVTYTEYICSCRP